MLSANPVVKRVNVSLVEMGDTLYPTHARPVHETAQHYSLYTESELTDYNRLVHFGRTKQAVLSEMTGKYCADTKCGLIDQGEYIGSFDLGRLENQVLDTIDIRKRLYESLATIGQIGGCLFVVHLVWKVFAKASNIHHLYVRRNTTLKYACQTSFYKEQEVIDLFLKTEDIGLVDKTKGTEA